MAVGDHIFVYAWGYSHHGIDCGDGSVVHFDGGPWRILAQGAGGQPAQIRRVAIDEFSAGRPVYIRLHSSTFVPDLVVERAASRIGETGYDLLRNNCEHFAIWCKTGEVRSSQADAAREAIGAGIEKLPLALAMTRVARHLPGRLRLGVYTLALGATVGQAAGRYLLSRLEHVSHGES